MTKATDTKSEVKANTKVSGATAVTSEKPESNSVTTADVLKSAEIAAPPLAPDFIVGDTVLYTVPRGPSKGEKRPALVVHKIDTYNADLYVFFSPLRDGQLYATGPAHISDVPFSHMGERGSFTFVG